MSSFTKTTEDRMDSSMYGSFLVSWCLWNWKFIYVTIFVDQDKILAVYGQLKHEYIYYTEYTWSTLYDFIWSLSKLTFLPALSAYLIVFQLSKIEDYFFRRTIKQLYSKKRAIDAEEKIFLIEEKQKLIAKNDNIEFERKIESELSQEQKWEIEYESAEESDNFKSSMTLLKNALYQNAGDIYNERSRGKSDLIAFLDVNDLIKFNEGNRDIISATAKGKYFLKKLFESDTRPE